MAFWRAVDSVMVAVVNVCAAVKVVERENKRKARSIVLDWNLEVGFGCEVS